jgi:hypothetical protein
MSRYLAHREKVHDSELGLVNLRNQAIFRAFDEIQLHYIAVKSLVIFDCQPLMSSLPLGGTEKLDLAHIINVVLTQNIHGTMNRVKAVIESGATHIIMSPRFLRILKLPHESVFPSFQCLNVQVIMSTMDSRKASLLV